MKNRNVKGVNKINIPTSTLQSKEHMIGNQEYCLYYAYS